ncbi:amino-acid N-acetyltransferase [Pontibacterium granulatum]|uniref:amino-acid N-acetyltransferase n=1 Tax=Pontibacterium granulatum TaxID=2036029 RepID=UPI00249CD848|nr:amino-acid N-acetyltransferase [Pontibacterium granulatum]MDI3324615.1 amino-acid N-acetyltransferase [Pontibacterium granulatum]
MINDIKQYVNWFRHSSPYINAHRGKVFVLMLGGEAVADPNFDYIVHDIALLNSLGVRMVLVHGSRPQIEARLSQQNLQPRLHHHRRVTDEETLRCVIEAAASVRTEIEARLSMGLSNTPMHGAQIRVVSGNFMTARPVGVHDGVDLRYTGEVRRIDSEAINHHLNSGNIVLLSHLGYSPTGEIFNLATEDVATRAATSLNADKLLLFGADRGVFDSKNELRSELLTRTAERLVSNYLAGLDQTDEPHTELSRHLYAAVQACRGGVNRCHLISYQEDGALLTELFTREGSGTMVLQESYEQIRQATIEDVGGLLEMIQPLEEQGVLVRRSRELLESEIDRFTLIERDGAIIGCAALYPFKQDKVGELACVVIDPEYRGGDRGDMLLQAVEAQARQIGLEQLFVLTTRTAHWFMERGFKEQAVDALPTEKKSLYNLQRNSKVFAKPL